MAENDELLREKIEPIVFPEEAVASARGRDTEIPAWLKTKSKARLIARPLRPPPRRAVVGGMWTMPHVDWLIDIERRLASLGSSLRSDAALNDATARGALSEILDLARACKQADARHMTLALADGSFPLESAQERLEISIRLLGAAARHLASRAPAPTDRAEAESLAFVAERVRVSGRPTLDAVRAALVQRLPVGS